MQALNPNRKKFFNRKLDDSYEQEQPDDDPISLLKAGLVQSSLALPSILTPDPSPTVQRQESYSVVAEDDEKPYRRRPHQEIARANTLLDGGEVRPVSAFVSATSTAEQIVEVESPSISEPLSLTKRHHRFPTTRLPVSFWTYFLLMAIPSGLIFIYAASSRPDYYSSVFKDSASPAFNKHADKIIFSGNKKFEKPSSRQEKNEQIAEKHLPRMTQTHLLKACEDGNLETVRSILGTHKSARSLLLDENTWQADATNSPGDHPIHRAARFGRLNVVKALINEYEVTPDKRNLHNDLPIHVAAFEGNWPVIEYLNSLSRSSIESRGYCNQTPLQRAAANGKLEIIKQLVKIGADIHAKSLCSEVTGQQGESAAHLASQWGHVDVVSYLVDTDRNLLEARNHKGRTPLLEAASHGHASVIEALVARGADLYARDTDKQATAVHLASCQCTGHVAIVDYLTTLRPDLIEARDGDGLTPLLMASSVGNQRIVEHLLKKKGANLHAKSEKDGQMEAIHLAVKAGKNVLVSNLLNYKPELINARTGSGDLPLHVAAAAGQLSILALLIGTGKVEVEATGFAGRTAVLAAVATGQLESVKYLVEKANADLMARSSADGGDSGATALHLAARFSRHELVPFLLNARPELISIPDSNGDLPIHAASVYDEQMRVLDMLVVSRRADIESIGASSKTPLIAAAANNRPQAVEYLGRKGANLNAWAPIGDRQMMAIHLAAHLGYKDVVQVLLRLKPELVDARMSNQDSALHAAAISGQQSVVESIVSRYPQAIETAGFIGRTPLLAASTAGQAEVVELLLRKGANVFAKDNEFQSTALHLASRFGHLNTVKLLVKSAPELLHATNKIKDQPIHRAVFGGHLNVIKYLTEKKADIEARGELGRTPLLLACTRGSLEVVNYLISNGADVMVRDFEHEVTALHLAAYFNHEAIVNRLIQVAPKLVEVKDKHGHTALDMAKQQNSTKIVAILQSVSKKSNN